MRFSVIIPAFNRARLIGRAVASCLRQTHASFEVLVVDDGSTDGTRDVVAAIDSPRIRLLVQPVNRGVSPARNLAASHARGEWIVYLDSDDELTDDALELIDADVSRVADDVGACRFMCRLDSGSLSPTPPLTGEVWDYEGYLQWAESATAGGFPETLMCVRRRTFDKVKFPAGRALEPIYHMDFAATFRTATSPSVVRLYHNDAPDQLTRPNAARALASAPDHVASLTAILDRHGPALQRWAPVMLKQYTRGLAAQQFLAGQRLAGARTISRLMRSGDRSLAAWAVLGLGLIDRRVLAHVQARRA